ncbi:MAG: hypothetical protein AAF449_22305, partial [Myxococcota bacterium]
MVYRRAVYAASLLVVGTIGCSPENTFTVRFPRAALRNVTEDLLVYLFAANADESRTPLCTTFDPRGAPFGDPEVRTGLSAQFEFRANRGGGTLDELGVLDGV